MQTKEEISIRQKQYCVYNKEKIRIYKKNYYKENIDLIKEYQLKYYHKTKKLSGKRNKIPTYLKLYNHKLLNKIAKVYILGNHRQFRYWNQIQEGNILGRHIREQALFTVEDYKEILKHKI